VQPHRVLVKDESEMRAGESSRESWFLVTSRQQKTLSTRETAHALGAWSLLRFSGRSGSWGRLTRSAQDEARRFSQFLFSGTVIGHGRLARIRLTHYGLWTVIGDL
jgi:hypothetical protein